MVTLQEIVQKQNDDDSYYKVNVCITCFNQKNLIGDAIRGVLNQKTTFPFLIIIGEDGSTDGSKEILEEYEKKYPEKIMLLNRQQNIGLFQNRKEMFRLCNAPYVAFCDGDDYWIDEDQLQRKVDFLEKHKEYIGYISGGKRAKQGTVYQENDLLVKGCQYDFGREQALHNEYPGLIDGFFFRNIYKYMSSNEFEVYTSYKMDDSSKLPIVAGLMGEVYRQDKTPAFICRDIENSMETILDKKNRCKSLWMSHRWMIDMVDSLFERKEHMQIDFQLEVLAVDSFYTAIKSVFKDAGKDNWQQFQYIFNDNYFTKIHICNCILKRFLLKIVRSIRVQG